MPYSVTFLLEENRHQLQTTLPFPVGGITVFTFMYVKVKDGLEIDAVDFTIKRIKCVLGEEEPSFVVILHAPQLSKFRFEEFFKKMNSPDNIKKLGDWKR